MKLNIEPLKKWFGFSRRERRSTSILLIIILFVIIVRYIIPESKIEIEYISTDFNASESYTEINSEQELPDSQLFNFDPNTVSFDKLIKLGLGSKEARTLIKYRNSGGRFIYSSDIKKVYGVDEKQAERLIPFVEVKIDSPGKFNPDLTQKKTSLVNLNTCDSVSLEKLPGIGPVLSVRILKFRKLLGSFAGVDQLKEVYGLSLETFDIIKNRVFIDTSDIIKTKINTADYKELSHIPYIEKYEVTSILKYRELTGRITGMSELIDNKIFIKGKAEKIKPYLNFE